MARHLSKVHFDTNDAIELPVGTTAQRPSSPVAGMFRYNSTDGQFEGYTTEWGAIAGGGGTVTIEKNVYTGDGSDVTFDTTTAIILGVLTVTTNLLFIPIWGIEGAAIATASTIVVFNLIRFIFVYIKLKIQPFSVKTILVLFILAIAFGVNEFLPFWKNIYFDTVYRSLILGVLIALPAYFLRVSDDINAFIEKHLGLLKK